MGFLRQATNRAISAERAARARQAREANAARARADREARAAARKQARAEANQSIREAERCVEWAREHGTPDQLREAQAIADQWRQYRDQL